MSSPKVHVFEKAVESLLSSTSNDARRQADIWLRQLQETNDAWSLGIEILSPECPASLQTKNVAAAMIANKLSLNSPPITNVQAAGLVEKFIPLCKTSSFTDNNARRVTRQLCLCVVRSAILQAGVPGQPLSQNMHTAIERLVVRSDVYAQLDPVAVLLLLEYAASELVRLTPPRSPAPVTAMGLGGMIGVVRVLKYSFGMGGDGLPWPASSSLSADQSTALRLAGLDCLKAWAAAGLELQTVFSMEPMAVRGLVSLLGQPATTIDNKTIQCVAATITASLEQHTGSGRGMGTNAVCHRYRGPPPAPQASPEDIRQHAEIIPIIVAGVQSAFQNQRHCDADTATTLVQLCVATANRTGVVLPLLCGAETGTVAGQQAAQQLIQILLQWLQSAAKPDATVGMPEPWAIAEIILDSALWEDVQHIPAAVPRFGKGVALWQQLLHCALSLSTYPQDFRSWEDTPFRRDASGRNLHVYGDEDEFRRFRRSFAREAFTTGCEVLGVRAVEAVGSSFLTAIQASQSPASSPQQRRSPGPRWNAVEAALFALGSMAGVVSDQTSKARLRAQSPRGVDTAGASVAGGGRGRGRGVAFGGVSPRTSSRSGSGLEQNEWSDDEVVRANSVLEKVFSVVFGAGKLPPLGADSATIVGLVHIAVAECIGNLSRWLRRHSVSTPAHAARLLTNSIRTAGKSSPASQSQPTPGDMACIALAKLTFTCCRRGGGAAGNHLCSIGVVQPLAFQVRHTHGFPPFSIPLTIVVLFCLA